MRDSVQKTRPRPFKISIAVAISVGTACLGQDSFGYIFFGCILFVMQFIKIESR